MSEPIHVFSLKCLSNIGKPHFVGQTMYPTSINKEDIKSQEALNVAAKIAIKKVKRHDGGEWAIVWAEGFGEDLPF